MARWAPAAAAALTLTIPAGPAVAAGPWSEPVAVPTIPRASQSRQPPTMMAAPSWRS